VERLKRYLVRHAACISVSRAVAADVKSESIVIGAPYDEELFRQSTAPQRSTELLFVGRLVSSTGVGVLIEALGKLRDLGHTPALTSVGDGPERPALHAQVRALKLEPQVRFVGQRTGTELRDVFCTHHIVVVPSVTPETFGIVAVEAIACGCIVVGSDRAGALPEVIGSWGATFKMGDPAALTDVLAQLLCQPEQMARLREGAASYVSQFASAQVANNYLAIIRRAVSRIRLLAVFLGIFAQHPLQA
jgi:glycosyltransferase involved in cell wall biosynthesis